MYGGIGNSFFVACLLKFPWMIPVVAVSGGLFYSTVCGAPAPVPPEKPAIVQAVSTPPPVVAPVQVPAPAPVVAPAVEQPKPVPAPLPPKKKIKG